jgi:protein-disulfide isomerase
MNFYAHYWEAKVNRPASVIRGLSMILAAVLAGSLGIERSAWGQMKAAAANLAPEKSLGSKSAPIVVEVFSDFQCPACRSLFQETIRPMIDEYVSSGRVYLVHRDFPLPMHKYAREAARWANAAAQIGKFEKVEEALFSKQEVWSTTGNVESVVAGVLTATELKRVRQLAQGGQLDAAIEKDISMGNTKNVQRTPSMFVTHGAETTPLPPGGVSYPILKQYLDYLLKK